MWDYVCGMGNEVMVRCGDVDSGVCGGVVGDGVKKKWFYVVGGVGVSGKVVLLVVVVVGVLVNGLRLWM